MKRLTVFICLLSAGMMWMPVVASAENHRALATAAGPDDGVISGVVEDAAGPMIGATVKVAGTSIGAVTDLDGRFTLKCKTGDELERRFDRAHDSIPFLVLFKYEISYEESSQFFGSS